MELEGELLVEYGGNCDDLINILLNNGYILTIGKVEKLNLKILYYKKIEKEEK